MAEVLIQDVTNSSQKQIRFFVTASFVPVDAGTNLTIGTPTDVAIIMAGVANGAARQSLKVELPENRAARYEVFGCVDFTGETPAGPGTVDYYWAPSASTTLGTGNIAANSGADGDAPDGAIDATLDEFLLMCQFIGSLVTHNGAGVQNGYVGTFSPATRWGQLVVDNNSAMAFENDDVEMHQVMNPIVDEIQ